jgi:nitroimidazol reductase NimA-like FMN-containing flavoprotein (pyridoxamine 5'-phosphate oxidase superfamily)
MTARWLDVMSTAECHDHLTAGILGRVAVSIDALPVILPVMYRYRDGAIWFLTEEGTKMRAATANAVVAFEVDHLDDEGGWSVLVIGQTREERDPAILSSLRAAGLEAGAPGTRDHLVCIPTQRVTGRSFTVAAPSADAPGYL